MIWKYYIWYFLAQKVHKILTVNPKSDLQNVAEELGVSKASIHLTLRDYLNKRKVCSHFVSHSCTQYSKDIIKTICCNPDLPKNIVTGDETWCYQYEPITKRQSSSVWKSLIEPQDNARLFLWFEKHHPQGIHPKWPECHRIILIAIIINASYSLSALYCFWRGLLWIKNTDIST